MTFDPNDHLVTLKGKSYLEVKWRLVWFRQEHPGHGVQTTIVHFDDKLAVVKATITDPNGIVLAQAHKQEQPQHFPDYLEKAETGAVGRALGYLGYGTQFAPEFDEGERIVDSPVTPPNGSGARRATAGSRSAPATAATAPSPAPSDVVVEKAAELGFGTPKPAVAFTDEEGGEFSCEQCGKALTETRFKDGTVWSADQLADFGRRKHRKTLCMSCYRAANEVRRAALVS